MKLSDIENLRLIGDIHRGDCPLCGSSSSRPFIIFDNMSYFCHACNETGILEDAPDVSYEPKPEKAKADFTQIANLYLGDAEKHRKRTLDLFDALIRSGAVNLDRSKLHGIIGYDQRNDTLAIVLKKDEYVFNIKRRKVGDIKWMGMKESDGKTPMSRLTGEGIVFVASGIAEYLILQMTNFDYVAAQSDSANLNDYIPKDAIVVVFEDNDLVDIEKEEDRQFADALHTKKYNRFTKNFTAKINRSRIVINFNNVCNEDKPKGYDLRDLINEYPLEWLGLIEHEIKMWANNKELIQL